MSIALLVFIDSLLIGFRILGFELLRAELLELWLLSSRSSASAACLISAVVCERRLDMDEPICFEESVREAVLSFCADWPAFIIIFIV